LSHPQFRHAIPCLVAALGLMGFSGGARAGGYTLSTLDYGYPAGSSNQNTWLYGINDNSTIVGLAEYFDSSSNFDHVPFTGTGAANFTPVPLTGLPAGSSASNTYAYGINLSGELVGSTYNINSGTEAFTDVAGTITPFQVNGSDYSVATGINTKGQIVGYFFNSAISAYSGFIDTNGTITVVNDPAAGSAGTFLWGINNKGVAVGYYDDSNGNPQPIEYSGTTFNTISIAGSYDGYAFGINNSGQIVGSYQTQTGNSTCGVSGAQSGFLLTGATASNNVVSGGTLTTFVAPTVSALTCGYTEVLGINDNGVAVGTAGIQEDPDGFIITASAVPEPATAGLFGSALFGLGLLRRRARRG